MAARLPAPPPALRVQIQHFGALAGRIAFRGVYQPAQGVERHPGPSGVPRAQRRDDARRKSPREVEPVGSCGGRMACDGRGEPGSPESAPELAPAKVDRS